MKPGFQVEIYGDQRSWLPVVEPGSETSVGNFNLTLLLFRCGGRFWTSHFPELTEN
jgi:hypothetical protein